MWSEDLKDSRIIDWGIYYKTKNSEATLEDIPEVNEEPEEAEGVVEEDIFEKATAVYESLNNFFSFSIILFTPVFFDKRVFLLLVNFLPVPSL